MALFSPSPDITLWFIQASRGIRIAWALEALSLPYELISTPRAKNGLAPQEWKEQIPTPLHKCPAIRDGETIIYESGAILEYLCDRYDPDGTLYPKDTPARNEARVWLHAAEGTFALHSMAILFARWNIPPAARQYMEEMEKSMSGNVHNDLGWLEGTLKEQRSKGKDFLVGDGLSIADIQLHWMRVHLTIYPYPVPSATGIVLSKPKISKLGSENAEDRILFIYERKICVSWGDGRYPEVEAWMKRLVATPSFVKAKERTSFTMDGDFRK